MRVADPTFQRPQPAPPRNAPPANTPGEDLLGGDNFEFDFCSNTAEQLDDIIFDPPAEAPPRLSKPVLLVHGFNSEPGAWKNMHTWLTRANKDGGIVRGSGGNVDGSARVFRMEFTRGFNPLSNNASELRQAIDRIAQATGSSEIDVVGHSMGGLDTRLYLDQGDEKVGKLVMLGTPNHGSVLADIELSFRGMGVAMVPPTDDPLVRQALRDCSEVRGDNNPVLAQLNKNWKRQTSRADMLIVAGLGKPTLQSRKVVTARGDGVVTQASAIMPDVAVRNIDNVDHGNVKEHPQALRLTAAFLSGSSLPAADPETNYPADKEIIPRKISADKDHVHYFLEKAGA